MLVKIYNSMELEQFAVTISFILYKWAKFYVFVKKISMQLINLAN